MYLQNIKIKKIKINLFVTPPHNIITLRKKKKKT